MKPNLTSTQRHILQVHLSTTWSVQGPPMEADRLLTFRRGVVEMGEGEGARLAGGRGVEGRRERREARRAGEAGWAEVTTEAILGAAFKTLLYSAPLGAVLEGAMPILLEGLCSTRTLVSWDRRAAAARCQFLRAICRPGNTCRGRGQD